jgi:hypothetical protein
MDVSFLDIVFATLPALDQAVCCNRLVASCVACPMTLNAGALIPAASFTAF